MRRRRFTILSGLSLLLLCVATGLASIRFNGPYSPLNTFLWPVELDVRLVALSVFFAMAAVGVVLRAVFHNRQVEQRKRSGHCQHCDYDLRATAHRCPEYGTPVTRNR